MQKIKMRRFFLLVTLTIIFASCAPQPVSVATSTPAPVATPTLAHAPEIKFALIGNPKDVNVWQLFDTTGASYVDYALRSEYWPRLYHLAPPSFEFQPMAAGGFPSAIVQEGEQYSATVKLRTDLKWTDGFPFTASDVEFTVNTALSFELGYDWAVYYPRDEIDHVQALDVATVKFFFKQKPNIEAWQYGALQGPIVQKAFWEPLLSKSSSLLPDAKLNNDIETARAYLATVQARVDDLSAQALNGQNNQSAGDLGKKQAELTYAKNTLDKLMVERNSKIELAHQSLYALDGKNEPTLGSWIPDGKQNNHWVNKANPDFPFLKSNFDRAIYLPFENINDAQSAFQKGEVDFILSPDNVLGGTGKATSPTSSARFLVFNPFEENLSNPALHKALSCMLDRNELVGQVLQSQAFPLEVFILSTQWHDENVKDTCVGMDHTARIQEAVNQLKTAGYTWTQEPDGTHAGSGLTSADGTLLPEMSLLAPPSSEDALRASAAEYIAGQAQYLGLSVSVQEASLNDIVYAVYSSKKYDMAIVGWRLSEYPAYMCQWFGTGTVFLNNSDSYQPMCDALATESDLEVAKKEISQFESLLMSNLPMIPLYRVAHTDVYQRLTYPSEQVLNGWSALYGSPDYAIPSQ
ncbi:MAG: ABC transporter substrate-binding protein [Anaerolineales bacterium]